MKVIFLDFNGIMDSWENMDTYEPSNIERLRKIVNETGAKIVLTTSNKNNYFREGRIGGIFKYILYTLLDEGFDVIGMTPMMEGRELEIITYLEMYPEIEDYVILDDDYDMPILREHLIKLPSQMIGIEQKGIQDCHVEEAIRILGKQKDNKNDEVIGLCKIPKIK